MTLNGATIIGSRICTCCARKAPVVSFRFVDVDVQVAACERCDMLTPRPWLPKEWPT